MQTHCAGMQSTNPPLWPSRARTHKRDIAGLWTINPINSPLSSIYSPNASKITKRQKRKNGRKKKMRSWQSSGPGGRSRHNKQSPNGLTAVRAFFVFTLSKMRNRHRTQSPQTSRTEFCHNLKEPQISWESRKSRSFAFWRVLTVFEGSGPWKSGKWRRGASVAKIHPLS